MSIIIRAAILAILLSASSADAQVLQTVRFNLTWQDNSNNEQGFHVEQCVGSGCTNFSRIGGDISANTVMYQDTIFNDPGDRTICYRVKAFNATGESAPSNVACSTTPTVAVTPASPSGLTVQPVPGSGTGASLKLDWKDNSTYETAFEIERDGKIIASTVSDIQQLTDSGLRHNHRYVYRVRAASGKQYSAWTPPVEGRTMHHKEEPAPREGVPAAPGVK